MIIKIFYIKVGVYIKFDKKEGSIIIYSDTALEKFMKYSQENHRGRKKKDEIINP